MAKAAAPTTLPPSPPTETIHLPRPHTTPKNPSLSKNASNRIPQSSTPSANSLTLSKTHHLPPPQNPPLSPTSPFSLLHMSRSHPPLSHPSNPTSNPSYSPSLNPSFPTMLASPSPPLHVPPPTTSTSLNSTTSSSRTNPPPTPSQPSTPSVKPPSPPKSSPSSTSFASSPSTSLSVIPSTLMLSFFRIRPKATPFWMMFLVFFGVLVLASMSLPPKRDRC